jgi:hypothetical protein
MVHGEYGLVHLRIAQDVICNAQRVPGVGDALDVTDDEVTLVSSIKLGKAWYGVHIMVPVVRAQSASLRAIVRQHVRLQYEPSI